jgi:dihydropteroate synthase
MQITVDQFVQSLNVRGKLFPLDEPLVMGILNVTPDSFYDGGKHLSLESTLESAENMIKDGVNIIDIGGYSSRPGASEVSPEEELKRVIPVISAIRSRFPDILISVDTFRSEVAKKAVESGAHIINDISGGEADHNMFHTVAALKVPYILMHMRGNPETMQQQTDYKDLVGEILDYFTSKVNALKKLGVTDILLDPGFGFAKTMNQNYELLRKLNYFNILNCPILVGLSRKSMIYKLLNKQPKDTLIATSVLNTIALSNGAKILRVHDVKEAKEVITLYKKVYS